MTSILVPVFGGLGNQMFQVAHGIALETHTGLEVNFTDLNDVTGRVSRNWEIDCFSIPKVPISRHRAKLLQLRILAARKFQKIHPGLHLNTLDESSGKTYTNFAGEIRLCSGYWQGEAFFSNCIDQVKSMFRFPECSNIAEVQNINDVRVAVHVRRGDYITDPVARAYHLVCDEEWYQTSIAEMRRRLPKAQFFIFSDDPDWSEDVFGKASDVEVVRTAQNAAAWEDMAAMSRCDHWIISNSSYSWWASYLGKRKNSIIIAPRKWFAKVDTKNLPIYSRDWICM